MKKEKLSKSKIIAIVVALVVILGVSVGTVVGVTIHNKSKAKAVFFDTDSSVVSGIDVSQHNGVIDWKSVKTSSANFAFVRVGYSGYKNGTNYEDKTYTDNLSGANKVDFPVGVYYYSQAITKDEAKKEAEFTLSVIKKYDIKLPVVMDVEYAFNSSGEHDGRLFNAKLSEDEQTEIINEFCKTVKEAGYTPMVYANSYMFGSKISPKDLSKDTLIWVADYNKKITYTGDYDVWQYSETGSIKGVSSKHVDMNYWYIKKG